MSYTNKDREFTNYDTTDSFKLEREKDKDGREYDPIKGFKMKGDKWLKN